MTASVPHLEPTQEAARGFFSRGLVDPILMLNLLRFRATADYSATPALTPSVPITGAEAYEAYLAGLGHRLAALEDSPLLPSVDRRR